MGIPAEKTTVVTRLRQRRQRDRLALYHWGAEITGISDFTGGIYNPKGIDLKPPSPTSPRTNPCRASPVANPSQRPAPRLPCTVLIPAALERVITGQNARQVPPAGRGRQRSTTNEADQILSERGDIQIIPDVLCNSGGVIVSYFEWLQNLQNYYWTKNEVFDKLHRMLAKAKARSTRRQEEIQLQRRTRPRARHRPGGRRQGQARVVPLSRMLRRLSLLLGALCAGACLFAADLPVAKRTGRSRPLAKVAQQPDVQFVRNGSAYDAARQ